MIGSLWTQGPGQMGLGPMGPSQGAQGPDAGAMLQGLAQVGMNLVTGNLLGVIQSGLALFTSVLQQHPPFQTEYAGCGSFPSSGWASSSTLLQQAQTKGAGGAVQAETGAAATDAAPSAGGARQSGTLAEELEGYERTLTILQRHRATFASRLERDGFISVAELQRIAKSPHSAKELRDAARFLLERPEYLGRILAACPHIFGWEKDDKFGEHEIMNELRWVRRERAQLPPPPPAAPPKPPSAPGAPDCASPPPADVEPPPDTCTPPPADCAPPPPPTCTPLDSILNAPGLSIEEKLRRVLMALTQRTDDELLEVMRELDEGSRANAAVTAKGASATAEDKAAMERQRTDQQFLQMRLQELVERRKAMFELMSNLSASFHAMARTAIGNLGRA